MGSLAPSWVRSAGSPSVTRESAPKTTFSLPQPDRWELVRQYATSRALVVEIRYPDVKNYEGRKIMVFDVAGGFSAFMKRSKGIIEPHFFQTSEYLSPLARFEPTERGWSLAIKLAETL